MLVGEARYFDIAKLELPNQTFEHHQRVRPLDSIVVEMSVSRKNYVDSDRWKLIQEPLWVVTVESFRQGSVRTVKPAGEVI